MGLFAVFGLGPRLAPAQSMDVAGDRPCAATQEHWISLAFAGSGWTASLAEQVSVQLEAGIAKYHLTVCPPGARQMPAIARIELTASEHTVWVSLQVTGATGPPPLERGLALVGYDEPAKALAIAVATEELIRASWADVVVRQNQGPGEAKPPSEAALPPRPEPTPERTRMGAEFVFERYTVGQTFWGLDLKLHREVGAHLGFEFGAGGRIASPTKVSGGVLRARALSAELGIPLRTELSDSVELALVGSAQVMQLAFSGESRDVATLAVEQNGVAVFGRLVALGTWHLGAFEVRLRGGIGLPLRGSEALAYGEAVAGAAGTQLSACAGIGGSF